MRKYATHNTSTKFQNCWYFVRIGCCTFTFCTVSFCMHLKVWLLGIPLVDPLYSCLTLGIPLSTFCKWFSVDSVSCWITSISSMYTSTSNPLRVSVMIDWNIDGAHATPIGILRYLYFPQGSIVAHSFWLSSSSGIRLELLKFLQCFIDTG